MKSYFTRSLSALLTCAATMAGAQPAIGPDPIDTTSDIKVLVEKVGTMPFVIGPGLVGGTSGPNLQSPISIGDAIFFIDQNDAIYTEESPGDGIYKIFSLADDAPAGLKFRIPDLSNGQGGTIDYRQRQAIFNISAGSEDDKFYVMLVAVVGSDLPDVPRYTLPDPVSGICCMNFSGEITGFINDLYNISPSETTGFPLPFPYPGIEHQVLYEFTLKRKRLVDPRPIAIFDSQGGPLHHGAAMLTLEDGRILYATGDAVPFGLSGLNAPQDPVSHLSKLLIIDPADGSIETAAYGLRNVQYMQIAKFEGKDYLLFADIGGWTAEEVNAAPLDDLLDTTIPENFGWGVSLVDNKAREGTFYVATTAAEGSIAFSFGTPVVLAEAPSPEDGFIQPHAQYERPDNGDPNGGTASTGPTTSKQFKDLTMVFSDLASGILYGTTGDIDDIASTIYALTIVDGSGAQYPNLEEMVGLDSSIPTTRVDPRLFSFPDGSAGVLLEATGEYFRITEVK